MNDQGEFIVTNVDKNGAGFEAGIRKNDVILKINGERPEDHFTFKKYTKIEQVKKVEFKHGTEIQTEVLTQHYSFKENMSYLFFPSIVFIICLVLSFIITRHRDKNNLTVLLSYFLLVFGLGYVGAGASSRGDLLARIIISFSLVLSPVILLHLLTGLFTSLRIKQIFKWRIRWFYVISLCLTGAAATHELSNVYYSFIDNVLLLFFLVTVIVIISMLTMTYYNNRQSASSPTIKVLLVGIFLSFSPFLFLYVLLDLVFGFSVINPEITLMFFLILPFTILYLIRKEHIIDIDFLLHWLKKDFLFSILAGFLFFIITTATSLDQKILNSVYVSGICLLIFTLKNPMFFKSTSRFSQSNSNFQQQLQHYFKRARNDSSYLQLIETITDEIHKVIPEIKTIHHFELNKTSKAIHMDDPNSFMLVEPFTELLVSKHSSIGSIIFLKRGFCLLIHENQDTSFYLFCSDKNNRTSLNPVEQTWLETLASYSHVLLTNQYTIDNVIQELHHLKENDAYSSKWLSNFLFSYTEKERVRLAGDLHDVVLQELIVINRGLESVLKEDLSNNVHTEIYAVREKVLDCIHTTRETCNQLSPPFLMEFGLIQAIEQLIKRIHLQANFHVQFTYKDFDNQLLQEESVIALYRITQELLTNAMKHSQATAVTLLLTHENNHIHLFYSDNGIGLDVSQLEHRSLQFSGLIGIKERVKGLDGTIQFAANDGLQLTIYLPEEVMTSVPFIG
ncbi:ATP-binding protein [Sporosarcina sp. FSL K6-2383]|uniref:ATP-binding protein n=1 Tax=Sporosarcina sp. FSL K6-2383 TaxID=2921556 RepID=UPI00315B2EA0